MRNIRSNSKGFTLIEVLVVVAILGILTAITQLAYFNIGTDEACDSVCANNLHNLEAEWFLENVLVIADAGAVGDGVGDGDANKGHGNDADGWDEDNPGNSQRNKNKNKDNDENDLKLIANMNALVGEYTHRPAVNSIAPYTLHTDKTITNPSFSCYAT